jgi:serine/threonine-protein kinase
MVRPAMAGTPADALSPGMVVAGTFEVERLLGRGGMGEVWLARHQRLAGKQVAIKVLHTQGELSTETQARFRREAEIAVRLEHPNIVQVLDFNTLPAGQPFIVMELLKGESLAARLKRGPLSPDETTHVMRQVGSALHVAHGAGVVHRDLKPENIFLLPTALGDQVKVLDFGISKLSDSGTMQTTDSVLMGTPLYMSPEQALGHNRDVTPQSDVFSLGSIAYECLAGKAPFEADNIATVVFRIAYEPHPPLKTKAPHVPDAMAQAVEHALQKDRAARTINVAAFVLELTGQVLANTGTHAAFQPRPSGSAGVLKPGENVDEQMMADATVAPPSQLVPKLPGLATPNPGATHGQPTPVAPATPTSATPTSAPASKLPLVAGGAVVIAVAAITFAVATKLDGAKGPQVVDAGAAVVIAPPVVDAGLTVAVVPLEVDAGAVVTLELDAGVVAQPVDAGAAKPVAVRPVTLTPPPPGELAELEAIDAKLKNGEWEEFWARRGGLRNHFTSKEGLREYLLRMVEASCQRSNLTNANAYLRQLEVTAPHAVEAAKRRCRKHRDWPLDRKSVV